MARLLLVLIVNGSEFHKTGVAWEKARYKGIDQCLCGLHGKEFFGLSYVV